MTCEPFAPHGYWHVTPFGVLEQGETAVSA